MSPKANRNSLITVSLSTVTVWDLSSCHSLRSTLRSKETSKRFIYIHVWLGWCVKQSDGCGEERPALALLPALSRPQSRAGGAAEGLYSVVQAVGGVAPDGCQPGRHPSVCHLHKGAQAAAQDSAGSLTQLDNGWSNTRGRKRHEIPLWCYGNIVLLRSHLQLKYNWNH